MSRCGTTCDTPVRREELSITRNSLRSRLLRKTSAAPSASVSCEHVINNINSCPGNETRMSIDEGMDFVFDTTGRASPTTKGGTSSPCKENAHLRESDFAGEVNMKKEQKHSTPREVRISSRAVSSTPNQELFGGSRLFCHVATQTNFTLDACEIKECDKEVQACIIKASEDKLSNNIEETFSNSESDKSFSISSEKTPLREMSMSKQNQRDGNNTPAKKNPHTAKKLSLRSKTMICCAVEKSKDKPTTLNRYKSMEEKRMFSNTYSLMPLNKTPPSCFEKVSYNPFEADMSERRGQSIFSPNVFQNVVSPNENSECLRWTIEDISSINPVPIDEDFTFPSDDEDSERESQAQQEIDRYFSETHNVPSPCDEQSQCYFHFQDTHNAKAALTPQADKRIESRVFKNARTQTVLSIPLCVSSNLQDSLSSFFKSYEQVDLNLSASTLRRKLFFQSVDEPASPVRFATYCSPVTRDSYKFECSPFDISKNGRHFTPLAHQQISSPEMSPVSPLTNSFKLRNSSNSLCKKTLNFHFTDRSQSEDVLPAREMTVITNTGVADMSVDYESSVPASQDTGYNTGELSQLTPHKPTAASTPSNTQPLHLQ